MSRRTILALAVAIGLGCARPAAPPPRDLPRQVAVLPPGNHTGDPLLVSGASFFERYALRTDRVTVSDALAAELIDVSSGRVRWHAERRPAPVATPGEVNVGDAYLTAAHKVVVEVLAPLGPERPAER